jgi:hypothetical protein
MQVLPSAAVFHSLQKEKFAESGHVGKKGKGKIIIKRITKI